MSQGNTRFNSFNVFNDQITLTQKGHKLWIKTLLLKIKPRLHFNLRSSFICLRILLFR